MSHSFCTRRDVYNLGLGPDMIAVSRLREIEAADAATGILTIDGAGLFEGDPLTFVVQGSAVLGQPSAALPDGLSDVVAYQAVPVVGSGSLFRVRPVGGATITSFGDAGSGVFSIRQDQGPVIDAIAINETANIEEDLTANKPPIVAEGDGTYAQILVGVAARRTAIRAALRLGLASPNYQPSLDKLIAGQDFDDLTLRRWYEGRYINAHPTDQSTELTNAPIAGSSSQPIAWQNGTL